MAQARQTMDPVVRLSQAPARDRCGDDHPDGSAPEHSLRASSPDSTSAPSTASPTAFLSINEQTFTPLSMASTNSDVCSADCGGVDDDAADAKRSRWSTASGVSHAGEDEAARLLLSPRFFNSKAVTKFPWLPRTHNHGPNARRYHSLADRANESDTSESEEDENICPAVPLVVEAEQLRADHDMTPPPTCFVSEPHTEHQPLAQATLSHTLSANSVLTASSIRRSLSQNGRSSASSSPTSINTTITAIIRPTPKPLPQRSPSSASSPSPDAVARAALIRTASNASSCAGSVAALEATAERFSETSSIEDAIRDAHDELKRGDSCRSSILLANSLHRTASDGSLTPARPQLGFLSAHSSIVDINSAARLGGYSPSGYVMSPARTLSDGSTRPATGVRPGSGEANPLDGFGSATRISAASEFSTEDPSFEGGAVSILRYGPGKASVRSVLSTKSSLHERADMELPIALNQAAFDEADRAAAAGDDTDDEDTIRANAHQYVDSALTCGYEDTGFEPLPEDLSPALYSELNGMVSPSEEPTQQARSIARSTHMEQNMGAEIRSPTSSGSGATFEQIQAAFGEFDGVHCDFETTEPLERPEARTRVSLMPRSLSERPKSYFDTETGQQMLFYPAPVPAMLNLPPKLSKKTKTAARQPVRPVARGNMQQESPKPRVWLQGPRASLADMDNLFGAHDDETGPPNVSPRRCHSSVDLINGQDILSPALNNQPSATSLTMPSNHEAGEMRRPARLTDGGRRESHKSSLEVLPPQLRASMFFDGRPGHPTQEMPRLEIKDGSAMVTLDSILDASAAAPVSAFVDHAYAGKLGAEVYGQPTKPKSEASPAHKRARSSIALLSDYDRRSRGSFLSILGGGVRRHSDDGRHSSDVGDDALSTTPGEEGIFDDEQDDLGGGGDADQYVGAPTTLLAELQLRKQQQKQRTQLAQRVHPDGLHSTLLELDTVAEVERRARRGKRVNLAWEDPTANQNPAAANGDDADDEDVPLGVLFAAKAAAVGGRGATTADVSALLGELNRPLGLMERRDMEEAEPLSLRRDRLLQGEQANAPPLAHGSTTMNLQEMQKRMSRLAVAPSGLPGMRSRSTLALPRAGAPAWHASGAAVEADVEGETLAERRRRLNPEAPLLGAQPVSGAFAAELISQFGSDDKEDKSFAGSVRAPAVADGPEVEETLGQRRRRLKAEKEAREREMFGGTRPLYTAPFDGAYNSYGTTPVMIGNGVPHADMVEQWRQTIMPSRAGS